MKTQKKAKSNARPRSTETMPKTGTRFMYKWSTDMYG